MSKISKRLSDLVDALPLKNGLKILEIGCGSGVAAREIVNRLDNIYVLAIDRSAKAIDQAKRASLNEIVAGKLKFEQVSIENFSLKTDEDLFDFAFAIRVGALDGRHPEIEKDAKRNIKLALKKNGKLYIDKGNELTEILL